MQPKKADSQASLLDQIIIQSKSSSSDIDHVELPKLKPPKRQPKMSMQMKTIMKPRIRAKKKYFSAAFGVNDENAIDVSKEPSPYGYPADLEQFAHKVMNKAWREDVRLKELKEKCYKKPSFQDRQKKGLLNRLYVKEPKVDTMKTVLDVDPQYFSIIEGRPIPEKLDIRTYIDLVRQTLRTKIICGYREDDIMLIEENLLLEQKMIDTIKENLQSYINTFEEFLYRDHTSAMQLLKESDELSKVAYEKYAEYKVLAKKYGAIRSSLYNSEEKWRNCKIYQKFLYTVSPMSWKARRSSFGRGGGFSKEVGSEEENIFGPCRYSVDETESSLTDILKQFHEEIADSHPPETYFTDPEQLMDVFRFMEMQNLNSLLHSEELAVPLARVKDGMRMAELMFDNEIRHLKEAIERLTGGISWEEDRAKYLEDLSKKLIKSEFKHLIKDDDVLNLHVFIEDVYETRIGPNDANLTMLEMMKGIEEKYRYELLLLDKVPSEQVALLEGTCYAEQMRIMQLAEKAAKQYTELERVTHSLNRAFAPSYQKSGGKEVKNRSPLMEPPKEVTPPPRDLTEEEEEYLEYFTDFCKYTDDPSKFGIDTRSKAKPTNKIRQEWGSYHNLMDRRDAKKVTHVGGIGYLQKIIMWNM